MVNIGQLPNSITIVFLGGHSIQTCLSNFFQFFFNVFAIRWPMCFEFGLMFILLLLAFSFCIIFLVFFFSVLLPGWCGVIERLC
jgi:hypothetical protein